MIEVLTKRNVDLKPPMLQPTTSSAPALEAAFDNRMKAPMCSGEASSCTAPDSLLRGTAANDEPNQMGERQSNTIDDCHDGTNGAYGTDESIESLCIVSVDPETDQPWDRPLRVGGKAKITARLHAYLVGNADPSNDYADWYYKSDAAQPWTLIGTKRLLVGEVDSEGYGDFTSNSFDIREGTLLEGTQLMKQVIRVDFRYQGEPSDNACTGGSWADTDDVIFSVAPSVPPTVPSTSPVSMIHGRSCTLFVFVFLAAFILIICCVN